MNRKKTVTDARKQAIENKRDEATKKYRAIAFPKPEATYFGDFEKLSKILEEQLLKYCVTSQMYSPEEIPKRIQQGKMALAKRIAKFYGMDKRVVKRHPDRFDFESNNFDLKEIVNEKT